jgi:hypothetical protein
MSAQKTGTPAARKLFGEELERLGLARTRRPGHESMTIEHRERHPDVCRPGDFPVEHGRAEHEGGLGKSIAGDHRFRK